MEGAGAYKQVQPQRDNLSQTLQYWGKIYGDERRAEEGRRDKEASTYNTKTETNKSNIDIENTGYQPLDTVYLDLKTDIQGKYTKVTRAAREAILNGDREKAMEYQNQASTLFNSFKGVKSFLETGSKKAMEYLKALEEGKVNPLEDKMSVMLKDIVNNKYKIEVDDKGVPFFTLSNGKKVAANELIEKDLNWSSKFNSLDETAKIAEKLGLSVWDEKSGRYMVTNTNLSPAGEERMKLEIGSIVDDPTKLSQVLFQATGGKVEFVNNDFSLIEEDQMNQFKSIAADYLEKGIRGTLKTKESKKVDPLDASNRGWTALRNAKKAAEYARRTDKNKGTTTIQPMTDPDPQKGQGFTLGKKVSIDPNGEMVTETFYIKKDGVYIQPYSRTEKSKFPTEEEGFGTTGGNRYERGEFRKATQEEVEIMSRKIADPEKEAGGSFNNAGELYKYLGLAAPTKSNKNNKGNVPNEDKGFLDDLN